MKNFLKNLFSKDKFYKTFTFNASYDFIKDRNKLNTIFTFLLTVYEANHKVKIHKIELVRDEEGKLLAVLLKF